MATPITEVARIRHDHDRRAHRRALRPRRRPVRVLGLDPQQDGPAPAVPATGRSGPAEDPRGHRPQRTNHGSTRPGVAAT